MKFTSVLAFFLLFSSCIKTTKKSDAEIKNLADSIITQWHSSATKANYENYFNLMNSNSVFIGTDITENWTKSDFAEMCKPYFEKGSVWDFMAVERNIYVSTSKDIIWFDESLNTWMGLCRGSGVLEKVENNWKIQHYVLSLAVPNEVVGQVISIKSEIDSTFLISKNATPKF